MQIESGKVVTLHYKLYDTDNGELVETSDADDPLLYLHGYDNILAGLEAALAGKSPGDRVEVTLTAEQAYGQREADAKQRISAKYLKHEGKLRPGMTVMVQTGEGTRAVTVLKVGLKTVDVDLNHPLAGKSLRFDVEVVDVRDATEEEKSHRHVHGPGGHHH